MCVSVGACLRLRFLILILLFYSIDASLYFQFVLHFVFRGVAQINTSVGALSVKYVDRDETTSALAPGFSSVLAVCRQISRGFKY